MSTKIRSIILSMCLLVLFVVNSTQPAIAYYNPLLEVNVTGYSLTAGDENEMSISIENIGDRIAYDVKAALTVPSTVLGISIVEDSYAVFEKIDCDKIVWMYPVLYVESNCPLGAYSLILELRYTDYRGATFIDSVQIGVAVDAVKPTKMRLSVDVEDYHVTAGTENEINITLTNVGEEVMYDIEAMLTSTSPSIVILEELSYLFDEISVGDSVNFRPLLAVSQGISLGAYSLTLTLDYQDSNGVSYRSKVTVGLFVDSIFSHRLTFKTEVKGYNIKAGIENEIEVFLTNTGDTSVYDVDLRLTSASPQIVVLDETGCTFDVIEVNSSVSFSPVLGVSKSAAFGTYSLTLSLNYKDPEGVSYTDTLVVGVFVNSIFSHTFAFKTQVEGYCITAGAENTIEITLSNVGDTTVSDVNVQLSSTTPHISVLKDALNTFNVIESNQSVHFTPTLGLSRNTPLGAYSLTLTLKYKDQDGTSYSDSLIIGVLVDSVFSYRLTFKAEVKKHNIKAGAENEIEVFLTNTGGTSVYDVDLRLASASPQIVVLKEAGYTFDVMGINSSVHFTPTLGVSRTTPLGVYSLTLSLKYKDKDGVSYSDSLIIGVLVDSVKPAERTKIAVQNFKVTPTEVFPGDELTVELDLKNLGAKATNAQAKLAIDSESQFVSLGATLVFVGDLGSNETARVTYNLRIKGDADATLYVLPLVISYYDVYDQPESLTEAISIAVHSIVDFRLIDIQPSVITAKPGETVTIEADLLLLGTETVDFVEVEIIEDPSLGPFSTVTESYEYIGTVDPDSPVLSTIQFVVDPDATSGNYTLQIRVSCWDGYNEQRQVTIELPIEVTEFSSQNAQNVTNVTLWDTIWTIIRILFGMNP